MVRTISEIEQELLDYKAAQPELENLDSRSKTSVWRLLISVVATAFWTMEKKWVALQVEIDRMTRAGKPMSRYWYQQEAMRFQYSFPYDEWGEYDNAGHSQADIEASKVVKYAAVERVGRKLLIKVATLAGGDLAPLSEAQIQALTRYFDDNGSAGTVIQIHSDKADRLKLAIDVYYDPILLDQSGNRLDGTDDNAVKNAIAHYLKDTNFNGRLSLTALSNAIERVKGVKAVNIKGAWSRYGRYAYDSDRPGVGEIDEFRAMKAGYARLDEEETTIVYKVN